MIASDRDFEFVGGTRLFQVCRLHTHPINPKISNECKRQCYHCDESYLTMKVNNYGASTYLSRGASHLRRLGLS